MEAIHLLEQGFNIACEACWVLGIEIEELGFVCNYMIRLIFCECSNPEESHEDRCIALERFKQGLM
jgi:hypothetical protein